VAPRASGKMATWLIFYIFANFGKIKIMFWKTKISGIILTPQAMFVPVSVFLLFLVFEIACGK